MNKLRLLIFLLILSFIIGCGGKSGNGGGGGTEYTLAITCDGYGKVTDELGYPITSRKVSAGTLIKIVPISEIETWAFKQWGGEHGTEVAENQIIMNSDKHITAIFKRLTHSIVINIQGPAGCTVNKELVMGSLSVPIYKNDKIKLVPVPIEGYEFDHWEGDLSGYELFPELSVDSDKIITAVFTQMVPYYNFYETVEDGNSLMRPTGTWSKFATDYHSQPYSWTDSPFGNYSVADMSLYSRFINMDGNQNPFLTFWHHYNLGSGHYCYVEISNDGINWAELKRFIGTDNSWKPEILSLNDYKSYNKIMLRFRLYSNTTYYTGDGWYIDDIKLGDLIVFSNYYDDAEPDSVLMEPDGQWAKTNEISYSGSYCWTDSPGGYYTNNTDTSLTSKIIDLKGTNNPFVYFSYLGRFYYYDDCRLEISTDNGSSWSTLKILTSTDYNTWKTEYINLYDYKDHSNIKIRFRLVTNNYNHVADGLYVDDIIIYDL